MPFFHFRQNNSGGSFAHDDRRGISINVIIEAPDANYANNRAESIGIYFDGCDSGQDCSCCGDRWYSAYGSGAPVPSDYDSGDPEIAPGELYPAPDDARKGRLSSYPGKWMPEGTPEGYIHYLDGRVEGFWADTAPRQDLDGSFGYGVLYYPTWDEPQVFMATSNGYDESGNIGPAAGKIVRDDILAKWEKPEKPTVRTEKLYDNTRILRAWFPTEDEALALAVQITAARNKVVDAIRTAVGEAIEDTDLRGDTPKRQWRSIVSLWKP